MLDRVKSRYWALLDRYKLAKYEKELHCVLDRGENLFIVHTPGRSGTMSLFKTLSATGVNVFQTHHLNPVSIASKCDEYQRNFKGGLPWHLRTAKYLSSKVINGSYPGRVKILTSIREPLGRELSAFFMDIEKFHIPGFYKKYLSGVLSVDEIGETFLQERRYLGDRDNWIDFELNGALGVDVYNAPFDHDKGFVRIIHGNIEIFIYRLEDADEVLLRVVEEATGVLPDNIIKANISSNDAIKKKVYAEIIPKMSFPPSMIEEIYNTRYCRHFYTKYEIYDFKKRINIRHM